MYHFKAKIVSFSSDVFQIKILFVFPSSISCHRKLIGKVKKMDKCVPHELNENHKCKTFEILSALLLHNQNYPFLNQIVTWDEKWILYDNHKHSVLWLYAEKTPQHFLKPKRHQKKVVTVWWSSAVLIYHSFIKTRRNHHSEEIL